jgi:hypothetical protein
LFVHDVTVQRPLVVCSLNAPYLKHHRQTDSVGVITKAPASTGNEDDDREPTVPDDLCAGADRVVEEAAGEDANNAPSSAEGAGRDAAARAHGIKGGGGGVLDEDAQVEEELASQSPDSQCKEGTTLSINVLDSS